MNNRIAVFASGGGSNLQVLIDEINRGKLNAVIAGLIASRSDAGAVIRARENDIPVEILNKNDFPSEQQAGERILSVLNSWDPCLIILAGYLHKIPVKIINNYSGRIINIHPSLLPKFGGKGFYGMKVHEAVIKAGEKKSGCSVHFVTENYDEGPLIEQTIIPVEPDDTPRTLAEKVLAEEHKLLPGTVQTLLIKLNRNEQN